jgi:hypothetical protein
MAISPAHPFAENSRLPPHNHLRNSLRPSRLPEGGNKSFASCGRGKSSNLFIFNDMTRLRSERQVALGSKTFDFVRVTGCFEPQNPLFRRENARFWGRVQKKGKTAA